MCIARALATRPEVVLMDEPCSALDPISTLKIEELMRELRQQYTLGYRDAQYATGRALQRFYRLLSCWGEMIEMDASSKIFTDPTDKRTEDYITGRFG